MPKRSTLNLPPEKGDGEILQWITANAKHKASPWEIEQWTSYQDKRGPDSDPGTLSYFADYAGKISKTRVDLKSWFDLLDADDYLMFGGKL
jgi:hypothetical protein